MVSFTKILSAVHATVELLKVAAPIAYAAKQNIAPVFDTIAKLTSGQPVTQADLDALSAHNDNLHAMIQNAPDGDEPGQPGAAPT